MTRHFFKAGNSRNYAPSFALPLFRYGNFQPLLCGMVALSSNAFLDGAKIITSFELGLISEVVVRYFGPKGLLRHLWRENLLNKVTTFYIGLTRMPLGH